jgi:hypothetical protein
MNSAKDAPSTVDSQVKGKGDEEVMRTLKSVSK